MTDSHNDPIAAEHLPDCIWQLDLDLRLHQVSPAAEEMFGIPARALVGSPLADHLDPADFGRLKDDLQRVLVSHDRTRNLLFEARVRHADGRLIPVEVHGRLLLDADGQPRSLVGVARDVSERQRRRAHQREAERERLLEQKLAALSRLAAAAAGPLSDLLAEVEADGDGRTGRSPAVERAQDLLAQLRALAGRRELVLRELAIDTLVADVLAELRVTLPAQMAVLHHPAPVAAMVQVDPAAIAEVLRHLCDNARQAMSSGGVIRVTTTTLDRPHLEARTARRTPSADAKPGSWAAIEIADTGAGLDHEARERVLEPFFSQRPGDTPGLGLSLANGIVRQHGGRLEVVSRPDPGTTIRVLLPVTATVEPGTVPPPRARTRLLVVDDDPDVRRYCTRVLGAAGYDVVACEDGAEAVAVLAGDGSFAAMLLDWALPGLDGRRVLEQARARVPRLPVLIISGHDRRPYASLGSVDDETPWLAKPFTPAALRDAVRRLLPQSDAARES
jgi:PAS domain S-box-containing protein